MKKKLNALLQIKESVRFKVIPYEMVVMFDALLVVGKAHQVQPVITGAAYENYPEGKVHDRGYAIDVRVTNLSDPQLFAHQIRNKLRAVSSHYKVLYGDPKHLDHIHIGFSWYFAGKL